jgi:hypothetical protein
MVFETIASAYSAIRARGLTWTFLVLTHLHAGCLDYIWTTKLAATRIAGRAQSPEE